MFNQTRHLNPWWDLVEPSSADPLSVPLMWIRPSVYRLCRSSSLRVFTSSNGGEVSFPAPNRPSSPSAGGQRAHQGGEGCGQVPPLQLSHQVHQHDGPQSRLLHRWVRLPLRSGREASESCRGSGCTSSAVLTQDAMETASCWTSSASAVIVSFSFQSGGLSAGLQVEQSEEGRGGALHHQGVGGGLLQQVRLRIRIGTLRFIKPLQPLNSEILLNHFLHVRITLSCSHVNQLSSNR